MKIAIIGQNNFSRIARDYLCKELDAEIKILDNNISSYGAKTIKSIQKSKTIFNHFKGDRKRILKNFRIIFNDINEEKLDTYEEFDIVIYSPVLESYPTLLQTAGYCLNETKENVRPFISSDMNCSFLPVNSLAIFGTFKYFEKIETILEDWFYTDLKRKLFLHFDDDINFNLQFFKKYDQEWNEKINSFLKEIELWKELEPHEKSKQSKPQEPIKRIELIEGYSPFSLEKMEDQEGVFIVLEHIDSDKIKSILVDKILLLREFILRDPRLVGLNIKNLNFKIDSLSVFKSEPGFYLYDNDFESGENMTNAIEVVKNDILTFFTRK